MLSTKYPKATDSFVVSLITLQTFQIISFFAQASPNPTRDVGLSEYFYYLKRLPASMQMTSFSTSPQLATPHPGGSQSKQLVFRKRHKTRPLKVSHCFSEPLERCSTPISFDDLSVIGDFKNQVENEELESTFGFEYPLVFTEKQPRRKHFKKLKISHQNQNESEIKHFTRRLSLKDAVISHQEIFEELEWPKTQEPWSQYHQPTIEDFLIYQKLGEGSYSEVFRAIEKHSGFICGLKILSKQKIKQEKLEDNLARQIKICSFLDHPNIAKIYTHFHDENYLYLVCEYASDRNLFELVHKPRIKLKKGMMSEHVINIIGQLTSAVKYLHNHNIIHRDVKPQNVLVTFGDTIKLCDFGWSVYSPNQEMRSTLCGTLLYLAPEMVAQQEYDESVDVWAVGVLTYELMADSNPFNITRLTDVKNILKDEVKFLGIRNKSAVEFMTRALEKDPGKRKSIYELSMDPFLSSFSQECCFEL